MKQSGPALPQTFPRPPQRRLRASTARWSVLVGSAFPNVPPVAVDNRLQTHEKGTTATSPHPGQGSRGDQRRSGERPSQRHVPQHPPETRPTSVPIVQQGGIRSQRHLPQPPPRRSVDSLTWRPVRPPPTGRVENGCRDPVCRPRLLASASPDPPRLPTMRTRGIFFVRVLRSGQTRVTTPIRAPSARQRRVREAGPHP